MSLAHLSAHLAATDTNGAVGQADPLLEALDCLRVAITLFDARERLIYTNRHFHYIFPSFPDSTALIGRSYDDMIRLELDGENIDRMSHPGTEEAFTATRRAQLTDSGNTSSDIHLADGRIIETKARATTNGGWIVLWSDATLTRHAYGRLETAIELSADAFAFWDREDRLVICNPAFAHMHGCTQRNTTGLTFVSMVTAMTERGLVKFDGAADAWIEKRLTVHRAAAGALTIIMADGHAYLVRERMTREGGRATICTDVTDHHRTEAAFNEQRAALAATNRAFANQANYLADLTKRLDKAERDADAAKSAFLRTMGHELKTPLNAIIGFSDLLQSASGHFSAADIGEYAGLIHAAGNTLLRTLNQIMDLTKIAAGRFPLNRKALSVRALLDNAAAVMAERAEDKSITLTVKCPTELSVNGDENALTTMLCQLVQNAVRFTQNGGTVCLSATTDGARVQICVSDNGPGVSTEQLARIVEPFEQLVRSAANESSGSGLGLPLVKALAELHDGTLTLDSVPGAGLSAWIDLPAA